MKEITATYIESFLFEKKDGFLIKYHFGKGLDTNQLDEFYEILEALKELWKNQEMVQKDIVFRLISVVSSLYMDLPIYADKEGFEAYEDIIYNLDTAISMCLNPDPNDIHFNTPLRDLGDV